MSILLVYFITEKAEKGKGKGRKKFDLGALFASPLPFDVYFMTLIVVSNSRLYYITDSFRFCLFPSSSSSLRLIHFNKLYFLGGNGIIRLCIIYDRAGLALTFAPDRHQLRRLCRESN